MKMLKKIGVPLAAIVVAIGQLPAANLGTGCLNLVYPGNAGAPSVVRR